MAKPGRKKPRYLVKGQANSEEKSRTLGVRMLDGRIAAEPSRQNRTSAFTERLFYEDLDFICRDCGKAQVWTAEQQKWWYEVAKGCIKSVAVRCRPCRIALREARQKSHRGSNQPEKG